MGSNHDASVADRPEGVGRAHARFVTALVWIIPAVWSSNYMIARAAGPLVTPHVLAFGRWGLVFLVLLAMCSHTLFKDFGRVRREWRQCLVLGALGMWICGAWVYIGGHTTTATNIGLIYAAAPVGIAIGSQRLLGERLSPWQYLSMAMALSGVLFVILKGDPSALLEVRLTPGDGWIAVACVSWICYSLLLKHWKTTLSAVERLCCITAGGLVMILPFLLVEVWITPLAITPKGMGLIVLAALLPGLISYLAYSHVQHHIGAARASLMLYLAPVYAFVLAWLILGERPHWYHAVGAALILPGIHFATRR